MVATMWELHDLEVTVLREHGLYEQRAASALSAMFAALDTNVDTTNDIWEARAQAMSAAAKNYAEGK